MAAVSLCSWSEFGIDTSYRNLNEAERRVEGEKKARFLEAIPREVAKVCFLRIRQSSLRVSPFVVVSYEAGIEKDSLGRKFLYLRIAEASRRRG